MSGRQTDLDCKRSRFVFKLASKWRGPSRKEATALAQGLPVAMRTQGLAITLARLSAKDSVASRTLRDMLFDWLTKDAPSIKFGKSLATSTELLERLLELDRPTYLVAQREALALSERIKLISKSFETGKEHDNES